MKATLEFDMPEEQTEHRMHVMAGDWYCALREIDNRLRSLLKHGNPSHEAADLADEIRMMIPDLELAR